MHRLSRRRAGRQGREGPCAGDSESEAQLLASVRQPKGQCPARFLLFYARASSTGVLAHCSAGQCHRKCQCQLWMAAKRGRERGRMDEDGTSTFHHDENHPRPECHWHAGFLQVVPKVTSPSTTQDKPTSDYGTSDGMRWQGGRIENKTMTRSRNVYWLLDDCENSQQEAPRCQQLLVR